MRRNVAEADLNADQHADHLGNNRAGAEKRRQQRERANQRQGYQSQRMAGERRQAVGDPVADAGGHDDADQRRDESHKRQNGFQHRINGVAPGLEQHRHHRTHAHPDLRQQAIALFSNLLAGVVIATRALVFRRRLGNPCAVGSDALDVVLFDAGDINIFRDVLGQRP